ncbi:unnamed protein product [Protopolystoma xenopodis]|uniref:Uncharacterized protein n=1 Tax=Protopolystoma xenopodis TaxID=117903 RepID=A0A3S5A7K6_9PLAT|nr:unnamed protein product [Protopolystoma xenopodis]
MLKNGLCSILEFSFIRIEVPFQIYLSLLSAVAAFFLSWTLLEKTIGQLRADWLTEGSSPDREYCKRKRTKKSLTLHFLPFFASPQQAARPFCISIQVRVVGPVLNGSDLSCLSVQKRLRRVSVCIRWLVMPLAHRQYCFQDEFVFCPTGPGNSPQIGPFFLTRDAYYLTATHKFALKLIEQAEKAGHEVTSSMTDPSRLCRPF